jgi:endonuclease-3
MDCMATTRSTPAKQTSTVKKSARATASNTARQAAPKKPRSAPAGKARLPLKATATAGAPSRKLDPPSPRPRRDLAPARIADLLARLAKAQPNAECALVHRNAWELLVATILSAQCTDKRVNIVTPDLFRTFPTPAAMAAASLPELEELVRTTGFFRNKAKSIQGAGKAITERFGGEVPRTLKELITVPGAARKTANVVLGVAYGLAEGVVVDTHVQRISKRLGLTTHTDPKKIEQDLIRIIPRDRWIAISHELILHGRAVCIARKPRCAHCPLETTCWAPDKTWRSH